MTADDLIKFVVKWEPFGGGDEYILPEFGIVPAVFYERVLTLLRADAVRVEPRLRRRLEALCDNKIRLYQR